jgi:peptide/nickel transport system permease protein
VGGINEGNFPVVQDVTMMLVTVFLLLSMIVDVIYAIIDPRIRLK